MTYLEGFMVDKGLLEDLLLIPGISGYEDQVRSYIMEIASKYGKTRTDKLGNLILELGGKGPRVVIAAHMDELGLIVSGIDENGLIAFRKIGGIDDAILPSVHVIIHGSKGPVQGVIGAEPPHLRIVRREQDRQVKPWYELRIDVGADSREEVEEMGIQPFNQVTFRKHISYLGNGKYISSRGLDDRAGCSAIIELMRLIANGNVRLNAEVIVAWTVQEEIGIIGARALTRELQPDYFIAVDTMSCCHPAITGGVKPGRGPVIRALDNIYITPPKLAKNVYNAAISRGIPVQVSTAGGGTDAAAFQFAGVPSIAVSTPLNYTHSLVEKMSLKDYRDWVRILSAIVESGLAK